MECLFRVITAPMNPKQVFPAVHSCDLERRVFPMVQESADCDADRIFNKTPFRQVAHSANLRKITCLLKRDSQCRCFRRGFHGKQNATALLPASNLRNLFPGGVQQVYCAVGLAATPSLVRSPARRLAGCRVAPSPLGRGIFPDSAIIARHEIT